MRKTFKIEGIDCPNCAASFEEALKKLDGVEFVSINFFTEKLILQAPDDIFDDTMSNIVKLSKKLHPEYTIKL